jgi:hypothetical protein
MGFYRKKPVVVEAFEFSNSNRGCFPKWLTDAVQILYDEFNGEIKAGLIDTMEGMMQASPGDFVIKGIKGEVYPCDGDIFRETYETVSKGE